MRGFAIRRQAANHLNGSANAEEIDPLDRRCLPTTTGTASDDLPPRAFVAATPATLTTMHINWRTLGSGFYPVNAAEKAGILGLTLLGRCFFLLSGHGVLLP